MEFVNEFAAVWAALNMELKNPPAPIGDVRVPPGVLTSSNAGVRGADIALDSLLGWPADLILLWDMPNAREPLASAGGATVCANSGALIESADMWRECERSVGVGGVTTVAGLTLKSGGVEGNVVTKSLGFLDLAGEGVFSAGSSESSLSSKICLLRLSFRALPLASGSVAAGPLAILSVSATLVGDVSRLFALNASFSLPTGEGLRLADEGGAFKVCDLEVDGTGESCVFGGGLESTVSVVIRGDEAVKNPICELCAESVGRIDFWRLTG